MKKIFNPAMFLQAGILILLNSVCLATPTVAVMQAGKDLSAGRYIFNISARLLTGGFALYLGL